MYINQDIIAHDDIQHCFPVVLQKYFSYTDTIIIIIMPVNLTVTTEM